MDTTPSSGQNQDLTRYCGAACDLNHAAIPHAFGDCNASLDAPTLTAEQRRALPDAELPWVRHATPLLNLSHRHGPKGLGSSSPRHHNECPYKPSTCSSRVSPHSWKRSSSG